MYMLQPYYSCNLILQAVVLPLTALAVGWLLVTIGFGRFHQILVVDPTSAPE
jgi:hypothetical protein